MSLFEQRVLPPHTLQRIRTHIETLLRPIRFTLTRAMLIKYLISAIVIIRTDAFIGITVISLAVSPLVAEGICVGGDALLRLRSYKNGEKQNNFCFECT